MSKNSLLLSLTENVEILCVDFPFLNLTTGLHEIAMAITRANAMNANKFRTQKLPMHNIDFSCHMTLVF